DGAVQARVPGRGAAGVSAGGDVAEVSAGERQAQRPGGGRCDAAAPYLLRDARQLLLWRLLQARGDWLRVGAGHEGVRARAGPDLGDGPPFGRRGVRALAGGGGAARVADLPFG